MSNTHLTTTPVFHQAGEGDHVLQMRACVTVKLAGAAAEGSRVGAAEFNAPPRFGPPLHVHSIEDELLQVLEGDVRVVCGDCDVVVGPGGFAYLPRGVPHTFRVLDRPARMLAVFTPGGLEEMFARSGVPSEVERLPEEGEAPPASLEALTAEYGVEHVGPPLEG
ncbi:MAG: hypothetical protein QOE65_397 [Solirubrobacteraceae bacterium]|jgi:mannose-6-phosphate isomerase-like protein (cupin superfamily)|nr:hypothetical protein [Solirubrobacteraceae bacterium]